MIYFDNNASTMLDPQVLQRMLPFFMDDYANASSIHHKMGRKANEALQQARQTIADYLHAQSKEIFFTSGATETINMVLRGLFDRYRIKGSHIVTCKTEHKAVLSTCAALEKKGAQVTYLPLDGNGNIDLQLLEDSIRPDTIVVSLMAVNNETGLIHPIEEVARICKKKEVLFFCDATQAIGKMEIDFVAAGVDILCFSAHKFHGPKGAGVLYVKRKSKPIQLEALLTGGNQEDSLRAGTYNVPAIVGMAEAIKQLDVKHIQHLKNLQLQFEKRLLNEIEDIYIHAATAHRVLNTSNVCFKHVKGTELMTKIPQLAVAAGSACVSGDRDPSHVLKAMGVSDADAFSSLRFSFSRFNTLTEIDTAVGLLKAAVDDIRRKSPVWLLYKAGML
ncbi:cysteine desulfurase family protein [Sphingobacterium sp. Mn56C]|uniref:cysteine desulfurase family protein n=1 Tax=Sphingobacterium sp. Mn56C TaxID=3395261 RepID=UPI003BD6A71D